ncbi:flippase [Methanobacterium spitsbergense]|uniref:Flippase n=1 Tax=Methanobacterium spitsbergense TaxID=2874285 RepID=A0A8T5UTV2_9EURY|nr:flippase [Methanobacterium spitsbergense]MBZ2167134.1 flippase [Methanobacterium spitsbergense]
MNTIQRITKNVGVLFISQLMSYVLGFFTLVYTARYLGVEGFGTLSLALAFTGIFSVCMDLGLSTLTIREVARNKSLAKKFVANITFIKIILAIFTLFVIFIVVQILGYNPQTMQVIYVIALYTVFTTFSQLFYAVFQANEKMEYQSVGVILSSVLLLAGVFLAIYLKFNIIQFSLIYLFSGASILCYALLAYSRNYSLPNPTLNIVYWKDLIKESWPFAITTISINIYIWIDTILLSIIIGTAAVGVYNASYKLVLILIVIPVVFNNAVYPLMSQYYISSRQSLNLMFEKLFKIMILIALPLGVGTVLIAKKVIMLIYGAQFLGAVIAMQILIWSIVLIFTRSPFERLLESSNRQLTVTKIFAIGVIFNVIMNIIVIPKYSYVGASIITVLTDTIVLALLIVATKDMGLSITKNSKISLIKIIMASLIMGIILKYLLNLNVFLEIIIGAIIYISILLILKIFDDEEIRIIKSVLR